MKELTKIPLDLLPVGQQLLGMGPDLNHGDAPLKKISIYFWGNYLLEISSRVGMCPHPLSVLRPHLT